MVIKRYFILFSILSLLTNLANAQEVTTITGTNLKDTVQSNAADTIPMIEIEDLDLDILGFIDHNITVNIIEDSKIVEKKELKLPSEIKNVIRCHNPRCITSIEQGLDHVFVLTDPENEVYRCKYCEEKYNRKRG